MLLPKTLSNHFLGDSRKVSTGLKLGRHDSQKFLYGKTWHETIFKETSIHSIAIPSFSLAQMTKSALRTSFDVSVMSSCVLCRLFPGFHELHDFTQKRSIDCKLLSGLFSTSLNFLAGFSWKIIFFLVFRGKRFGLHQRETRLCKCVWTMRNRIKYVLLNQKTALPMFIYGRAFHSILQKIIIIITRQNNWCKKCSIDEIPSRE